MQWSSRSCMKRNAYINVLKLWRVAPTNPYLHGSNIGWLGNFCQLILSLRHPVPSTPRKNETAPTSPHETVSPIASWTCEKPSIPQMRKAQQKDFSLHGLLQVHSPRVVLSFGRSTGTACCLSDRVSMAKHVVGSLGCRGLR